MAPQMSYGLALVTTSTSWIRKCSSKVRRMRMSCSGSSTGTVPRGMGQYASMNPNEA